MTYSDLYHRIESTLPTDLGFAISVETWRHGIMAPRAPETTWLLHICTRPVTTRIAGASPEEIWEQFCRHYQNRVPINDVKLTAPGVIE